MNIHEYQAKAVLKSFGAPVAEGVPVLTLADVQKAVDSLPGPLWVVKSQIHAGGRGKGKFVEAEAGEKGGVRLAFSKEDVLANAKQMLGHHLVTAQTGPPASRSTASISKTAPTLTANCISPSWLIARRARWRLSSRLKAAWTLKRLRTTRPRKS